MELFVSGFEIPTWKKIRISSLFVKLSKEKKKTVALLTMRAAGSDRLQLGLNEYALLPFWFIKYSVSSNYQKCKKIFHTKVVLIDWEM